ncbi:diacylglycerol kinase family protein [Barnesiella viscericola]|uniref:diacylglycerol kinase family protein n=1 Tax=Barnesiella viscericola TaxID=397865 RepID=UPI002353471C|nr:diacylglycerol kinase family protein [Barnesiella viscericola]
MEKKRFSLTDRARSFKYAGRGIARLISREHNAWIHCFVAVCVVVAGLWLGLSTLEWAAVVLCIGAVLAAEGINSAIEALCDRVSPGYDEAIKHAKDLAAGAVLILAVMSVIVGLLIFIPKFIALWS